jgi:ATP-dependent HslUV protease subunit HslV
MFRLARLSRPVFHSVNSIRHTTIVCIRKDGHTVMAGDGQVSQGQAVLVKGNAQKVRRIGEGIVVGFAGSTADALTLLERLEKKLEEHPGQLMRACVELAKNWRTDKYLRRLEATLLVADANNMFELTGNGDVLEPEEGVMGAYDICVATNESCILINTYFTHTIYRDRFW